MTGHGHFPMRSEVPIKLLVRSLPHVAMEQPSNRADFTGVQVAAARMLVVLSASTVACAV